MTQSAGAIGSDHGGRCSNVRWHVVLLLVDDLAGLVRDLRSRGAQLAGEPVLINAGPNQGGLAMYVQDPNGVLVELFQPPARATP